MQIFIDSADSAEIRAANELWPIEGVTTNPSLILKSGRDMQDELRNICALIDGPISAEAVAEDYPSMMREAEILAGIAANICIKLPMTYDGLKACRALSGQGQKVNMTLCFSSVQAMLAAKAGATYISPFIGRLDDTGQDGLQLIADIRKIYDNYGYETKILAASVRTIAHIGGAALAGADCATLPPALLKNMAKHELTDKGLAAFAADWEKTGQVIGKA